ncbi:MAG: carbohydrate ABC transporter permease [Lachnospiraceae bacterium]|nr:carbohydrate ABC transporter permease [Lachnospiraceae bacterium]
MKKSTKIKNKQDRWFYFFCYAVVTILTLLVLYPIVYIISASFSNSDMVALGKVWLWPVDFSLASYKIILKHGRVWTGYKNTILYTAAGTLINVAITLICAYPMARKNLWGRRAIIFFFTFTMMFSGGMIPSYILVKQLGMLNTRWAMVIPGAMNVYNMVVCRTFIENNIPDEMLEAAKIDGCNNTQFFFQMVLPLSKAIIAVMALWYGVGHWNSYFGAFLYLRDQDLYPLQIFLKEILIVSQKLNSADVLDEEVTTTVYQTLKYCVVVVASAPLFCVYPFVQKYFQEGALLGSVKG